MACIMRAGGGLWARPRSARRIRCSLLAVFLVFAAGSSRGLRDSSQAAPQILTIAAGSAPVEKEIVPGTPLQFTVSVPVGATVVVTITEEQQYSSVTWTDGAGQAHLSRTNLAGKNARIRLTLPGSAAPQSVEVSGTGRRKPSTLLIAVISTHP